LHSISPVIGTEIPDLNPSKENIPSPKILKPCEKKYLQTSTTPENWRNFTGQISQILRRNSPVSIPSLAGIHSLNSGMNA
jgi:hypothetical protein